MRTASSAAALITLLALAACGKSDEVKLENASVADVAEATKDRGAAVKLKPGQWRTTAELVSIDVPGLSKEMADQIGQSAAKSSTTEDCVTQEEADKPQEMLARDNGECRYDRFQMSGGKIDAVMRCKPAGQPNEMQISLSGNYQPERYDVAAEMVMTQQGKTITMRLKSKSERIGECKA
ncbi:putative small lipoprotein YifL [Sphingomonas zeicaulis]|uniref:DUF3617 domain-containing protein n=1 Tax=Sphingomonas zeicaulis TaxID=1632740 RepID=UPI003D1BCB72